MSFSEEVKKIIKGEVFEDESALTKYSHDASIFEVRPQLVVAPKDAQDIQALVKFANEQRGQNKNVSLTARSAGTDMSGGPLSESIILDMTAHFNQVQDVQIDPDKQGGFAVVEPGAYYRDFEKETDRRDLMMPSYPASKGLCTVGGMVANNAGGEKTPAYGKTENYLLELKVVLADGNEYTIKPLTESELEAKMAEPTFEGGVYKKLYTLITDNRKLITDAKPNVTKNSAGYYLWNVVGPAFGRPEDPAAGADSKFDLCKLFVGSQGTLGIITQIKFRLVPKKKFSKLLVLFLRPRHMKDLGNIIVELKKHAPETIESYDDNTLKLAMRFFPDLLKILKPKNMLVMAWHLFPEFWMFLTGGMPKMVIMAEFTGDDLKDLHARIHESAEPMKKFGVKIRITASEEEERQFWVIRRESFSLMRNKVKDRHSAPCIDDFAVLAEKLPEFLPKLQAILDKYHFSYGMAGHPGDGNFHIFPMLKMEDPNERAIIPKLSDEVYNLVLEYKGTITAEHNDGLIRTPYLEKMYGPEVIALFEQTKKIFDPLGIFNPGKKTGGSLGYSMAHIRKSF